MLYMAAQNIPEKTPIKFGTITVLSCTRSPYMVHTAQFVKRLMKGSDDSFPTLSFALIIKAVWMLLPWIARKHAGPATLNVFAINEFALTISSN